ncbi:hypothetical protein [Haladaptatus caseinilyticus]|uniref:hypothetical protein n=1 Tax=Haladaptatus caseinilyticus TaxID=2993314 RepID=UPI00224A81F7|nr:hypothetical protein [Haladaptatus caseinilyticus]
MSTITDLDTIDTAESDEETNASSESLSTPVRFIGFWTAVALPFLYMPLLVTGLDTPGQLQTFLILLTLNLIALLVGHRHRGSA